MQYPHLLQYGLYSSKKYNNYRLKKYIIKLFLSKKIVYLCNQLELRIFVQQKWGHLFLVFDKLCCLYHIFEEQQRLSKSEHFQELLPILRQLILFMDYFFYLVNDE